MTTRRLLAAAMAVALVGGGAARGAGPTVIDAAKYSHLQAALDAVPEAGGLVRLPPGEFRITKPLVLTRGNTRIEGCGTATRIVNCNEHGEPALMVHAPDIAKKPRTRLWRVQLANFQINGDPKTINDKSTQPKGGDGIVLQNIDELYIHGMTVDHHGGHGINLLQCYEDPRVADSVIEYNKGAGLNIVAGHDIVVNANHFEENQDAVRCVDSFNLCMNGNNVDDHLGHGVVIENTYGSVLSGNMIEECNGIGVIVDRDCYGITLSANVIAHNTSGGIDLRDAWGCAVSANTFTIDGQPGLRIGPGAGRITVTGNNFSNSHIGGKVKREDPAGGIVLEATSENVISGNLFTGLVGQAITAKGDCWRLVITGNLGADLDRNNPQKRPGFDLGQPLESVLQPNLVQPPAK